MRLITNINTNVYGCSGWLATKAGAGLKTGCYTYVTSHLANQPANGRLFFSYESKHAHLGPTHSFS